MADILITGGAGNFGRTLAQALRGQGHSLTLLDLPGCDFSFFDGWENTNICPGDILDPEALAPVIDGPDWLFHLAAILPPFSEEDRNRTFKVNVDGTAAILEACKKAQKPPNIVFASSISVFGDASQEKKPLGPDFPTNPNDIYAESKVEAENLLMHSGLPWVNLRISAIAIPEFLDPPEPWPFMPDQRIELVALSDLVRAMVNLVESHGALNKSHIISGGPTWQVTGESYVRKWSEIMDIPYDEMTFLDRPGWLNWYDTSESQQLLNYQGVSLESFYEELKQAVEEALA